MIYLSKDIQNSFLTFFQSKNHTIVEGSSVIPTGDNTLLFTNAGMNQFKDFFTGIKKPTYDPVTTAQRCIRAGGKHNDLDQVGFTSRHLTHFTMLGNFSFGAYFKKEAILNAWEYLTKVLQLDSEKLWVTVYKDDQDAYDIWHKTIGIPLHKISKLDEKDNFWQMGDVGPCGPCSEIYYDRGIYTQLDAASFPSDSQSERFLEIWNLVFIEYEKKTGGTLEKLVKPGIDTGMGLERLASVIQKKNSVYQTDMFTSLIEWITKLTQTQYTTNNESTFHVLCDHVRTASLLLASNILPSNEGRGYVLRKIIRRALLFSKKIYDKVDLLALLSQQLIEDKNSLYYDLEPKKDFIYEAILEESKKFFENIDKGIGLFKNFLSKQTTKNLFTGKDAFVLYDTYGFPLEITAILAQEHGLSIDIDGYENEMTAQQERSRKSQKFSLKEKINTSATSEFIGYHELSCESQIKEIYVDNILVSQTEPDKEAIIIVDKTVFYPGGGGQVPDQGILRTEKATFPIPVLKVHKYDNAIGLTINSQIIFHRGETLYQEVDKIKRLNTAAHHSTVHLLHKAIELYFQDATIYQDGSYVCDQYFTLDVVMKQNVEYQDKKNIELIVNAAIAEHHPIIEKYMTYDAAINEGATALFTEKYNKERVRVIDVKNFAIDLCGGCHAKNTGDIGFFILKEIASAGVGTKRFIGCSGFYGSAATKYITTLETAALKVKQAFSCPLENIENELQKKNMGDKEKQKEMDAIKTEYANIWGEFIQNKNKNTTIIFEELPSSLKAYEKNIIEKIDQTTNIITCLYQKKNNDELIIYLKHNPSSSISKEKLETILANELNFKGRSRNNVHQGSIKNINLATFIALF